MEPTTTIPAMSAAAANIQPMFSWPFVILGILAVFIAFAVAATIAERRGGAGR